ncbi:hypothetical protein [Rhizobium sp. BK376]|uniref:hypothetical protein n=1 Tax=Rhizobium sp. BK376 TaxID=2512149 RepID=UPI001043D30A|nr:hypothetical protein [Rhizobium sp. BK376]TCR87657.1 hypothetical protein EV561_1052 [Rhizobium sp. BK376]
MSLLTLLSSQDEQIEIVTNTVRQWCDEHNHDIHDERGRFALQAAVALALTDKWDPSTFASRLRREMDNCPDLTM